MDKKEIEKYVKQIEIKKFPDKDVEVKNKSPLILMGKGRQGAVFYLTDNICIKVYGEEEDCEREYYAYSLGKDSNLFPKIYAKGKNFIAMEIVRGVDLREYLQSQPLTIELSQKLIDMLLVFKEIGFERIDHHKRQIYLQSDGNLKVIDVGRTVWRDRVYPYPRKLINSLGKEYKNTFLQHVKQLAPDLYEEWKHYIEMEKLSSRLTSQLLNENVNPKEVRKKVKTLLSKNNEEYERALEDLIFKVFKEEWIKVLVAQGKDPDKIKGKIKEHMSEFVSKDDKKKKKIKRNKDQPSAKYRYGKKKKK